MKKKATRHTCGISCHSSPRAVGKMIASRAPKKEERTIGTLVPFSILLVYGIFSKCVWWPQHTVYTATQNISVHYSKVRYRHVGESSCLTFLEKNLMIIYWMVLKKNVWACALGMDSIRCVLFIGWNGIERELWCWSRILVHVQTVLVSIVV